VTEALPVPDSLTAWIVHYQCHAVAGTRPAAAAAKIALHLGRFQTYFATTYGHDRLSACVRRDVLGWQAHLRAIPLAPATVNSHLASLTAFTAWVTAQAPTLFAASNPGTQIGELGLGPLEPRALTADQVRSLKSVCDRLPRFHQLRGQRWRDATPPPAHQHARPWRDRAIVFVLLSTGLRREELTRLDLDQVEPATSAALRTAHRARINRVHGKGNTERVVFLSADARTALADYLERERPGDAHPDSRALFLSATGLPRRLPNGRLAPQAINAVLTRIGRWHDSEQRDPARRISPLRPHDLRHTFAFQLAHTTGADSYELERRLGHRSPRYIARYTNPPEAVAAGYVEDF
jgi:integrase